jgi:hypothetical protein
MSHAKPGASQQVKIIVPKKGLTIAQSIPLVASGRASETLIGVSGECIPISGNGPVISGLPIFYALNEGASPCLYHWAIIFRGFEVGAYQLTVTGLDANGNSTTDSTEFTVGDEMELAEIGWPPSNTDITADAGDFNPYGELIDRPLGQVLMTDSQGNQVQPLNTWGDYQVYQLWVAYFPPLSAETYSLNAHDDEGSGTTVTGLLVS